MIVKKDNVERIVDQIAGTVMLQKGWKEVSSSTETVPEPVPEEPAAEEKPAKRTTKKKTEGAN